MHGSCPFILGKGPRADRWIVDGLRVNCPIVCVRTGTDKEHGVSERPEEKPISHYIGLRAASIFPLQIK